jgi:hypothetical protein
MNNEQFMDAVVQMVLFLEFSDPEKVDEDAAIGIMEQIAATLQKLGPTEKDQFLGYLTRRASHAGSEKERQSLENLATNLGLAGE